MMSTVSTTQSSCCKCQCKTCCRSKIYR